MATTEYGYLDLHIDDGYLEGPYLGGEILEAAGMQLLMFVVSQDPTGMQANQTIANELFTDSMQVQAIVNDSSPLGLQAFALSMAEDPQGMQAQQVIADAQTKGMQAEMIAAASAPVGMQAEAFLVTQGTTGMQASAEVREETTEGMQAQLEVSTSAKVSMQVHAIVNALATKGMQAWMFVEDALASIGMSAKADTLRHALCEKYLLQPYLSYEYLTECMQAFMGMQVLTRSGHENAQGMEVLAVVGEDQAPGMQAHMIVNVEDSQGMQVEAEIREIVAKGMQAQMVVNDYAPVSMQAEMRIDTQENNGMQTQMLKVRRSGMQSTMVIYNITQLRMMCEFPSRGTAALGGNNWVASSTATGDFLPKNVNTDIVEQVWRSGAGAALQTLTCDTGLPQGVPIDTIAILNHNLTRSATVQVQGSNDNFATPPNITFDLNVETLNMYFISPEFPKLAGQNRYWRFIFQDFTNPAGYIQVGTILFGVSEIFSVLECFTNPLVFGYKHFKDSIPTEGFTNVSNDRALKRYLRLDFSKLNFFAGNFRIINDMLLFARTSLKCLVIPTPEYPSRFAVFAKLAQMPEISHTSLDATTEYIDLSLEWDESL